MSQGKTKSRFAIQITGIALGLAGCAYDVTFSDCEVHCQGSGDCPDGFSCQASLCRAAGMTGPCGTPGTVTLRQTGDDMIDHNLVFACTNADGTTSDTSWYRVFSLSEAGVTGDFAVDRITLGVATVVGTVTVEGAVGTYSGTFGGGTLDTTKISKLAMASSMLMPTGIAALDTISLTATIPAGSNLLVEIDVPDQNGTGNQVNIGSTDASQAHPAYLRAPKCGQTVPTTTTGAGLANAAFVLTVEGTGH
jgi:hypothetical protein